MRVKLKDDYLERIRDGRWHLGISSSEEYFVMEASHDSFRVVDTKGEPILYPKELFDVLDHRIPKGWEFREYDDGEWFLSPMAMAAPGFYEEFFGSDGDRAAQARTRLRVREVLEEALTEATEEDKRPIERALERLPH